jgi:hypothetical protein
VAVAAVHQVGLEFECHLLQVIRLGVWVTLDDKQHASAFSIERGGSALATFHATENMAAAIDIGVFAAG